MPARDNQVLLSVKPSVDFYTGDDPDTPPVGIQITNAGPGLAIIKSVTFYGDRKSVRDAEEAGITYGGLSQAELDFYELEPDDTLALAKRSGLSNSEAAWRQGEPKEYRQVF